MQISALLAAFTRCEFRFGPICTPSIILQFSDMVEAAGGKISRIGERAVLLKTSR